MRAIEYIKPAIEAALSEKVPNHGLAVMPLRVGNAISVTLPNQGGQGTSTIHPDPGDAIRNCVLYGTVLNDRLDTLDKDPFNLYGNVVFEIECHSEARRDETGVYGDGTPCPPYGPQVVAECILSRFQRDGVLVDIHAQYDEASPESSYGDYYSHTIIVALMGTVPDNLVAS